MRDLWRHWPEIRRGLAGRDKVLFLLDFDGTLSPIAPAPHRARFPKAVRDRLEALAALPRVEIVVLSGRPLAYLRRTIGLASARYGGNHGLEISGPGVAFVHPEARRRRPDLISAGRRIREAVREIPGAFLEDKGLTLSLHHRMLKPGRRAAFNAVVRRLRRDTARLPLAWRRGRRVWEVRPETGWDKGRAALYFIERLGDPFPVALGDDDMDEDAFRALEDGLTIRIAPRGKSAARYFLKTQGEVPRLLQAFRAALEEPPC